MYNLLQAFYSFGRNIFYGLLRLKKNRKLYQKTQQILNFHYLHKLHDFLQVPFIHATYAPSVQ